jgi:UDP-glucose-4-epimerase GalE
LGWDYGFGGALANVLVTGGAGFIGSHVCKALSLAGHGVVVVDDLSRGRCGAVRYGELVTGRIHDYPLIFNILRDHAVDAVIHLAAFAYVEESTRIPEVYFENNVNGTYWLLEAMLAAGVNQIVFSSSCAVYGEAVEAKIKECHPCRPINPYGLSKLMCEKMVQQQRSQGIESICLRYFNATGADPEGELGEDHEPEPHIIPNLVRAALGEHSVSVFGLDYPTQDGSCVRDFIHVWDLAQAHVLALEQLLIGHRHERSIYNLGTGKGHSLLELIQETEEACQRPLKWEARGRRAGDPPELVADASLFEKDFNWQPQLSDIKTMIQHSLNWERTKL